MLTPGKSVEVSLVGGSYSSPWPARSCASPARHDPAKEHGAFATPKGRARKPKGVAQVPDMSVREVPDTKCLTGTGT